MTNQPLITIIIPTFNHASLLKESIDSVLNQTYENWECIVVDDGSTDDNIRLAESYSSLDDRITLYKREDFTNLKGGNACRNIGINKSKGEYLIFLDGDDLLLPHCLEQRINKALENPFLDFIVFQMSFLSDNKNLNGKDVTHIKSNYLYSYLSYDLPWQTSAALIKKTKALEVNLFDESFPRLQDPEFYTKLLLIDDIKFKLFLELPADVYYRIMANKQLNYTSIIKGFSLYIIKFSDLTKNRNDRLTCRNNLKKTFLKVFKHLDFKNRKVEINQLFLLLKLINKCYRLRIISLKLYLKYMTKCLLYLMHINDDEILRLYYRIRY